ncbi:uncharacterized protein LOC143277625 [Babylonia areolata]|uniref:uncharacterized protein LOC143277625 n=1 Tax=Babylonia areolata TaxID=304850 RepID=UPI003FD181A6
MATGGRSPTPQSRGSVTSVTDCPHCGSLCLGPVLLGCGHILCRMCLRDERQQAGPEAVCKMCSQHLGLPRDQPFSQIVDQLGTDPVMEQLVHQALAAHTDIRCLNCDNNPATRVCVDCHDFFCDTCSKNHVRGRATKDHLLAVLPQSLLNAPSAAHATPRPRSPSIQSTTSLDSIRNDPQSSSKSRSKSSGVKEWKEWVGKEVGLLQEAYREELHVETTLQDIVTLGQQLLDRVQAHREALNSYQQHLPGLHVIQGTDPNSFVIHVTDPDVTLHVQAQSLKRRVSELRGGRQWPEVNRVQVIRKQLSDLLNSADQQTSAGASTSTTPVASPPSSMPTPTSAHLPSPSISPTTPTSPPLSPPTHPATPTFTPPVDVMTAAPRCVFKASPTTADDTLTPWITAVVCLPDDRLVMADLDNNKVKVMGMAPPHTVSSLSIPERPYRLAELSDGLVAVTTYEPVICLVNVTANTVTVRSRVRTNRMYDGIAGHRDGHMIVSCVSSYTGPASVDVLNRQGHVVTTVTDSTRLTGLKSPDYLFDTGDGHVLVSDYQTNLVHQVCVRSGQVTQTFQHAHVKRPCQVCADTASNIYIVSCNCECVCVRSRGGQWRQLVTPSLHGPSRCVNPIGLCLTSSGHLVVTWYGGDDSVVVGYTL